MMVRTLLMAAAAVTMSAGSARAAVTFDVAGTLTLGFAPAGTLTGTFTTDDTLTTVTGYDLVASGLVLASGFTFTPGNSAVTAATLPTQFFRIDTPDLARELQIYFANGLSPAGGIILGSASYEYQTNIGTRTLSGTVTRSAGAVPEPAAWAMMVAGFAAAGFALRRRARPDGEGDGVPPRIGSRA